MPGGAAGFKSFQSDLTFALNWQGQFEFESNVEALCDPSWHVYWTSSYVGLNSNRSASDRPILRPLFRDHSMCQHLFVILQLFSRDPANEHYCLAHLFTHIAFDNGVLGLAYRAAARRYSLGGICSPCK